MNYTHIDLWKVRRWALHGESVLGSTGLTEAKLHRYAAIYTDGSSVSLHLQQVGGIRRGLDRPRGRDSEIWGSTKPKDPS